MKSKEKKKQLWVQGFVLREDELLTMTQLAVVFSCKAEHYVHIENVDEQVYKRMDIVR